MENPEFQIESLEPPERRLESKLRLPQFTTAVKVALIAVGAMVLIGALYLIFGRSSFTERKVIVKIDGPSEISSGDRITYTLHIANDNGVILKNTRLTFIYPTDAVPWKNETIAPLANEFVDIGTIEANSSIEKKFEAYIVGTQGSIKNAKATITYIPEDMITELQKSGDLNTTITTVPVPITIVAPPTIMSGQQINYIIDYRNQSGKDLSDVRIKTIYPDGFAPKQKKDTWDFPALSQSDGDRITIAGTLSGRERESKIITVQFQQKIRTSDGDQYVTLESFQTSSVISTSLLSAIISVQGSSNYVAHLNDRLQYSIRVTNNTNSDLSSFTATAKLDGSMYDLVSVKTTGSLDSRTRTVLWNSAVVPEFGLLRANQSVVLPLEVRIKNTFPSSVGANDVSVKLSFHVETVNVPDVLSLDSIVADDSLVTRVSTAPAFYGQLNPTDAQWGSFGPYPPQVDRATVLTEHFVLINPANDLSSVKVTVVVLPDASWRDLVRVSGTDIQPVYNQKTSTLTWDIGTLPSGVGVSLPNYELFFQISVTPSVNQAGGSIQLIKDIVFEGTDVLTKEKIVRNLQDVTVGVSQ